jgi:NADPH-dependent 2,4-dienoyl-CoA reductase/sulfur reductase-like enzyme
MKRTIVIVGGVAGGASAATRARRLNEDARIIIIEKDDTVSYANCGMPYYIGGEIPNRSNLAVATPKLLWDRFRIETWLEHEAQAIDRGSQTVSGVDSRKGEPFTVRYDKLILAVGASPIVPDVPGIRSKKVFTLRNLADMDRIHGAVETAKRAVIVGAGFIAYCGE